MSIESMTVLIHLMDVYSYIFVIKCRLLCRFYTVYIAVLFFCLIHAWRLLYLPQKGQRMHDMHVY